MGPLIRGYIISLFAMPEGAYSDADIIRWWEQRRIPYTLFVLVVGSVCFVAFLFVSSVSGMVQGGEDAVEPMALCCAPFLANFAYTGGWVAELLLRRASPTDERLLGPTLLKAGIAVSLAVMLLPPSVSALAWAARVVTHTH